MVEAFGFTEDKKNQQTILKIIQKQLYKFKIHFFK